MDFPAQVATDLFRSLSVEVHNDVVVAARQVIEIVTRAKQRVALNSSVIMQAVETAAVSAGFEVGWLVFFGGVRECVTCLAAEVSIAKSFTHLLATLPTLATTTRWDCL